MLHEVYAMLYVMPKRLTDTSDWTNFRLRVEPETYYMFKEICEIEQERTITRTLNALLRWFVQIEPQQRDEVLRGRRTTPAHPASGSPAPPPAPGTIPLPGGMVGIPSPPQPATPAAPSGQKPAPSTRSRGRRDR